jgi:hypothetical protein
MSPMSGDTVDFGDTVNNILSLAQFNGVPYTGLVRERVL